MFSNEPRCILRKNQLAEVICQLRFPEILIISAQPPAAFQEMIREVFPIYQVRKETPAPKLTGAPGNISVENQQPVINYQFSTADHAWRINLTNTFISLTCTRYSSWEEFAQYLDKPLAAFIQTYKPAHFSRIGLRYLNFISRNNLDLTGVPYSDLIESPYIGILGEEDIQEAAVSRSGIDAELAIRGGCRVKIHAGPGLVKQNGKPDPEAKFIFDQDLFMNGTVPVNTSAGALHTLHGQSYGIFRGAITDRLYQAMEPEYL